MIEYESGSLFDAPVGSILVHACNAQGVWGSGIAKEFKQRFPESAKRYEEECKGKLKTQYKIPGWTFFNIDKENGYYIGGLITSWHYGGQVDQIEDILISTETAVKNLLFGLEKNKIEAQIYSNKFNSGLFGVPWEQTEKVLSKVIGETKWIVRSIE